MQLAVKTSHMLWFDSADRRQQVSDAEEWWRAGGDEWEQSVIVIVRKRKQAQLPSHMFIGHFCLATVWPWCGYYVRANHWADERTSTKQYNYLQHIDEAFYTSIR